MIGTIVRSRLSLPRLKRRAVARSRRTTAPAKRSATAWAGGETSMVGAGAELEPHPANVAASRETIATRLGPRPIAWDRRSRRLALWRPSRDPGPGGRPSPCSPSGRVGTATLRTSSLQRRREALAPRTTRSVARSSSVPARSHPCLTNLRVRGTAATAPTTAPARLFAMSASVS